MNEATKTSALSVSVIIPARNEEANIGRCLQSLQAQTLLPTEIIVVDDGSTDNTAEIAASFSEVKLLTGGGRGPSAARNLALLATRADVVAFTDADCLCHPRWLEELINSLLNSQHSGVGGDQQSPTDESSFGQEVQKFFKLIGFVGNYVRHDKAVETKTSHNPSCNVAYWRRALMEVGCFDEKLWPGEDVDLDYRLTKAGHTLLYNPRAVVEHYRPANQKAFNKMMRSYGRAQGYLVRKHGPFRLLHGVPLALLGGAMISPLLVVSPMAPLTIASALGGPYAFFLKRGASPSAAGQFTKMLYLTIFWWNIGFASEFLSPTPKNN